MFSTKLLRWFRREKRVLPWRTEPRDPYRTWISEVMLQQTRVDVVIPYYQRFLKRFPTLDKLAEAPLDDVLALWSGLGYYSRARNLHKAAQAAGGALPRTAAELRELPGFGPYTAAAVASLAFGEDVPLVDGNVARVLARVFALDGDARAQAWRIAPGLLPRGRAGQFNEAHCTSCTIRTVCRGRDAPEQFPEPKKRPARPLLEWEAVALRRRDGAILLVRRPPHDLFAGMWDLPATEIKLPGVRLRGPLTEKGVVEQTLTHRQVRVTVKAGRASGTPRSDDLRWVGPNALHQLGLSSLARKSLRKAGIAC
ncbi:MAG: A/G-specific adenine glycosylase [Deltaproteobacteria bacterium]|nr:MAG: A/G-specific adenine glycosylase [Deltaproteobacteria bacterium]